ncbi:MAG: hypothetical protein ACI4UV_08810 [Victivallales bacterium]
MKLRDLEVLQQKLRKVPSLPENWYTRLPLLERFDELFGEPEAENDPALNRFYHHQCRRAIKEIRSWNGPGIRLWKLYSSAVLIKDETGCVTGFDLNDGCTPARRRARLQLSTGLLEDFSRLIDRMFYTHGHLDHLGLGIADALLMRGKTVVAPQDAIRDWLLNGAVPAEECPLADVRGYPGVQRMANEGDIPNFAYAVTFKPDTTLFVRGDIYMGEDLLPILERLERERIKIDAAAISPFFQSAPDPVTELYRRFHCHFIPVHEWEFGHRRPLGTAGRATQTYRDLYESFRMPGQVGDCTVLTWGESVNLVHSTSKDRRKI